MATRRYSLVLFASMLVAAIATLLVFRYINANTERNQIATLAVVVAAKDIAEGAEIRDGDIRVEQWPEPVVPENAFAAPVRVVGRVAHVAIFAGEAIVPGRLAPEGTTPGLEAKIAPGKRAIGVRINDVSGMNGMIQPNSRVDILVASPENATGEAGTAKLFMEDMRVLAMGSEVTRGVDGRVKPSSVAMIEVTPDEAERLAAAAAHGQIQLVLRGFSEPMTSKIKKTLSNEIANLVKDVRPASKPAPRPTPIKPPAPALRLPEPSNTNTSAPAAPPPKTPVAAKPESLTVQVWRGTKRSDEKLTKDSVKRDTIKP